MQRSILLVALVLSAMAAHADIAVLVIDRDLESPLEGVSVTQEGSKSSWTTDQNGEVLVVAPSGGAVTLTARMPGYDTEQVLVPAGLPHVRIAMRLAGSPIEGKELVVVASAPGRSDAEPGLSSVVSGEEAQAEAMGIVEDAFSSVKTLPGVGYSGPFDSRPSINGGDPAETVATLDGVYVLYPYQWGGTFTIFNPDFVGALKLSSGVIGAQHGQVLSSLLEVSTALPRDQAPHADFGLSTTGLDLAFMRGFGDKGGLMAGGKVTWMELPILLAGQDSLFSTEPYLRNATARVFWRPIPTVTWMLGADLDTDGVAGDMGDISVHIFERELLLMARVTALVREDLLYTGLASYNSMASDSGTGELLPPAPGWGSVTRRDEARWQLSSRLDWTPSSRHVVSLGVDELLEYWSASDDETSYSWTGSGYSSSTVTTAIAGKNTLSSGAYLTDQAQLLPGVLKAEGGLRVDHDLVFGDGQLIQTMPVLNPRLRLVYTLLKDRGPLASLAASGGAGLFSQFPADDPYLDERYGVRSLEVRPARAVVGELGMDAEGKGQWTAGVHGYARRYFSRFYQAQSAGGILFMDDGKGFSLGYNLALAGHSSLLDASLSYSFAYTRMLNPGGAGLSATSWKSPLGTWYFPSYSTLHTGYAQLRLKPGDMFSVMLQARAASGTPTSSGAWSPWRYPVDLKLDWHGVYPGTKLRWECYLGCEDLLAPLYSGTITTMDSSVSFDLGFPIPSLGFKLSY